MTKGTTIGVQVDIGEIQLSGCCSKKIKKVTAGGVKIK